MEQDKPINVAIVGGGPGGKAIMDMIFTEKLSQLRMKLIGVACTNREAVGYRYAREKGIYTTGDYRDLYKLKDLNLIIELTGRDEVANEISRTKPDYVRLIDHVAAHVFWDLFQIEEERIAERKRAEEAMRETELQYRGIFDSATDSFLVFDFDGNIVEANPQACQMYGYSHEELIGLSVKDIVHPSYYHLFGQFKRDIRMTGEFDCESVDVRKDGTTFNIRVRGTAFDYRGDAHLLAVIRDITERKRAEEEKKKLEAQLEQAQKMEAIGTLAGGIAHDFNNLLMGVQGNVSLMLMDTGSTHPYYERLRSIEKQVQSGARLTSHLLGYARKGKYEVKPFDLNQLVEETSEAFGRTRKQITVHSDFAKDLFAIEGDPGQIEQVLWNLLINAADAMPRGGDLILKTINVTHQEMKGKVYDPKSGNYVLLTVTDTGIGMDRDIMERIFDPFFTTKEMGRGTGLGLASVYGIIKAHGGYIDVESKKGCGTTFTIYLPASEKKVQETVKTAERVIKGTGTVLLVDDEKVILEVGQDLLEAMGYRVLLARDGKEAIEVYRKHQDEIDIVVLDMVMPSMDGGEAYDRMKEINPDIRVLLSSGYAIDGEATEILKRGCDAFIQKPFNMKELSQAIKGVLGKE